MSSGVKVDEMVLTLFKTLVKERKHRCAVFKINEDYTKIVVERTLPPSEKGADAQEEWKSLADSLPDNDCRYVAYDFSYEHQGAQKTRVVLVLWSPEMAKVRSKMVYASSQEGLVKNLLGVQRALQCTDTDEISYKHIAKQLAQHTASY